MAAFNRINASGEVNITTLLRTGAIGNVGFRYNDASYNVFGAPISTSQANLPYGYGSPVGYAYSNSDLCNSFGPKETGYSASGTHTLNAACTKFMIMAVGGGGGGGSGAMGNGSANTGNTGHGGSCIYVAYPIVAGQTTITFTIGTGGGGGTGIAATITSSNGNAGSSGTSSVVTYNSVTYATAFGGPGGSGGRSSGATPTANGDGAAATYNGTPLLANSLLSGVGTYIANAGATKTAIIQGPNSGFEKQFGQNPHYSNTSSSGRGYGGSTGAAAVYNGVTPSGSGIAGTSGWVSIFEYFN